MDWFALLKTLALCLISIIIEAVSVTKEGKSWFENLSQPKFAFAFSFWYIVGGLYYLICGIIAYRQFHISPNLFSIPIVLLTLIMIINGLTNFILFKFRSLKMFYWVLFPFALLFVGLILSIYQMDLISVGLATIYLLWLGYDIYYFRMLWKVNRDS
jgi:tryptophan-rich sensory protein